MNDVAVQIRFGILCDDIRREDNGKLLLIGVYDADVRVPQLPTALVARLVVGVDIQKPLVPAELEVVVSLDDARVLTGKGKITLDRGRAMIPLPQMRLPIEHDGVLQFKIKLTPSDPWVVAWDGPVSLQSSS
jgi:hypothetical protein